MQETQAKALITSERSYFADLFALFLNEILLVRMVMKALALGAFKPVSKGWELGLKGYVCKTRYARFSTAGVFLGSFLKPKS